jgi:hypothetical protein
MYKNIVKYINTLIVLLFIFPPLTFANSINDITTAHYVDIAGQQRMYAHQALVAYSQIGQIQSFGNPVDLKMRAIHKFDQNLTILKQDDEIALLNNQLEFVWNEFKMIILAVPDKQNIPILIELNEKLLQTSNQIIAQLVTNNNNEMNIINISGQQRMLSQRIALFMLIENWGIKENYTKEFTHSMNQFAKNLMYLKKNKNNTDAIKKKLASVEYDYNKLIKIITIGNKQRDFSFSISRLTSQILRKTKRSTKMYVKLSS